MAARTGPDTATIVAIGLAIGGILCIVVAFATGGQLGFLLFVGLLLVIAAVLARSRARRSRGDDDPSEHDLPY